jgi:hypothetical protein
LWTHAVKHVDVAIAVAIFVAVDRAVRVQIPTAQAVRTICASRTNGTRNAWCACWTNRAWSTRWTDRTGCACGALWTHTVKHIDVAVAIAIFVAVDCTVRVQIPTALTTCTISAGGTDRADRARSTRWADWTDSTRRTRWAYWTDSTRRTRWAKTIQNIYGAITIAILIAIDAAICIQVPATDPARAGWTLRTRRTRWANRTNRTWSTRGTNRTD